MVTVTKDASSLDEVSALLPSWRRHLRAENKSPRTVQSYEESVFQFEAYLHGAGMATDITKIVRSQEASPWVDPHILCPRS